MKQLETLFNDHEFFASLINGPCRPWNSYSETVSDPIDAAYIDDERSAQVTQALHSFLGDTFPFFTTVRAIIPPEVEYDDPITDPDASRPRYIFVTVLDDSIGTYHFNFNIFHQLALGYLFLWEMNRNSSKASDMEAVLTFSPESRDIPVLNLARIEWATLDVTKEDIHDLPGQYFTMNRYVLPEMDDPGVQKILEVYK